MFVMANELKFEGTVLRIEPDGFGIVKFDKPIGPSSNTFGIFSSSSSSTLPFSALKPGVHVAGTAEADEHEAAAIRTIILP
jgi:hypothetical protein